MEKDFVKKDERMLSIGKGSEPMEIQLQELIDQIKKDGVEVAEKEAVSILESAKAEAAQIISDAKAEADKILLDAKAQNERMVRVSEDSIRQAGRNLLLSFRESVAKELDAIVGAKVSEVYSSDELAQLIVKAVEAWTKNAEEEDVSVLIGSKDMATMEKMLLAAMKEKMLTGVTLKANDNFDGGFRIAVNNGQVYYDYSTEAVTQMLTAYLSPKVIALMKEAESV